MDAKYLCSPPGLVAVVGSQLACVSCGQEMAPPRTILQCTYGHNLCGPCAQDSEVGTVQYSAVQYSTVQYTANCSTVQYSYGHNLCGPCAQNSEVCASCSFVSSFPWTLDSLLA